MDPNIKRPSLRPNALKELTQSEFWQDFLNDVMPHIEKHHRVQACYSSGVFGIVARSGTTNTPSGPTFEELLQAKLDDAKLKKGLKLI